MVACLFRGGDSAGDVQLWKGGFTRLWMELRLNRQRRGLKFRRLRFQGRLGTERGLQSFKKRARCVRFVVSRAVALEKNTEAQGFITRLSNLGCPAQSLPRQCQT